MEDFLSLNVSQMPGLSVDCACGRQHAVHIRHILVGSGILCRLGELAAVMGRPDIFLIADGKTYAVCGSAAEKHLREAGANVHTYVFHTGHPLVPDEKALGRLLVEMPPETALIVAVGTGTLNDLARMLSFKVRLPYWIVATAPSMDGFASSVSPLMIEGFKTTYSAVQPTAIVADTGVLKDAPMEMIRAGFGDILGKYTALTDWVLARELHGEYYCEKVAEVTRQAVEKCVLNRGAVMRRDEAAVGYLMEALILSGLAIGFAGSSRPASGAEHHMAHYWEMDALRNGYEHALHGNCVGAAAVVSASLYELLRDRLPEAVHPPKPEMIAEMLRSLGAAESPATLGISRALFHQTILHAMEVRERYTILRFAHEAGMLPTCADQLTRRFYAE